MVYARVTFRTVAPEQMRVREQAAKRGAYFHLAAKNCGISSDVGVKSRSFVNA